MGTLARAQKTGKPFRRMIGSPSGAAERHCFRTRKPAFPCGAAALGTHRSRAASTARRRSGSCSGWRVGGFGGERLWHGGGMGRRAEMMQPLSDRPACHIFDPGASAAPVIPANSAAVWLPRAEAMELVVRPPPAHSSTHSPPPRARACRASLRSPR